MPRRVAHRKEHCPLDSAALARLAFEAMGDKQARDLIILDLRPVAPITDFFVIGTADSERQIHAVVGAVLDKARAEGGGKPNHVEGDAASGWVLVDFADVVVHVFDPARRAYYAIERLWDGAPLVARMA
jgi:ribosome-associated protein